MRARPLPSLPLVLALAVGLSTAARPVGAQWAGPVGRQSAGPGSALADRTAGEPPADVTGEAKPFWIAVRAGAAIPTGELGERTNVGLGFGGAIGYDLSPAWAVFANVDWGSFGGQVGEGGIPFIDQSYLNYYGALGYDLLGDHPTYGARVFAGAGATTFILDDLGDDPSITGTDFSADVGLKLDLWLDHRVGFTVHAAVDLVFASRDGDADGEGGPDLRWIVPVHAGLQVRF